MFSKSQNILGSKISSIGIQLMFIYSLHTRWYFVRNWCYFQVSVWFTPSKLKLNLSSSLIFITIQPIMRKRRKKLNPILSQSVSKKGQLDDCRCLRSSSQVWLIFEVQLWLSSFACQVSIKKYNIILIKEIASD